MVCKVVFVEKLSYTQGSLGDVAIAPGYSQEGDGGGGTFYWDTVLEPDNDDGGTIIFPKKNQKGCWVRIYNGSVNVKWFGAKEKTIAKDVEGNNIAFQKALDKFDSIFIPKGVYQLSKTLVFKRNNQELYGQGYRTTQIESIATDKVTEIPRHPLGKIPVAITTGTKDNYNYDIKIRDFGLKGNKELTFKEENYEKQKSDTKNQTIGLEIYRGAACKIENLYILQFDVGLQLTGTISNTISGVIAKNCGVGFNTQRLNISETNTNSFYYCQATVCKFGFCISGNSNCLHNCQADYISGNIECLAISNEISIELKKREKSIESILLNEINKEINNQVDKIEANYHRAKQLAFRKTKLISEDKTVLGYAICEFLSRSTYISNMYIEYADAAYFSVPDLFELENRTARSPRATTINSLYYRNPVKIKSDDNLFIYRAFGDVQATTTINGIYIIFNQEKNQDNHVGRITVNCNVLLNGVYGGNAFIKGEEVQISSNCKFASDIEYSDVGIKRRAKLVELSTDLEKMQDGELKEKTEKEIKEIKTKAQSEGYVSPDLIIS